MAKKKNQNNGNVKNSTVKSSTVKTSTVRSSAVNNLAEKRKERNQLLKNQPVLYIILAIAAFIVGNYLFDLLARIF